jgi:glycerol-3-phosphate cytidylyltransferase
MISFLNRHKFAASLAINLLLILGTICGVDSRILQRSRELRAQRQIEFALGFALWFLLYRLHVKLPTYNIYHLVPPRDKEWYLQALRRGLDDYRVEKQYHLLESVEDVGDDFTARLQQRLVSALRSPRKNTSFKIRKFDTTVAFDALCRIDDVLKAQGVRPFLVSGTLLGAIRDGALIKGDNDLDIGVMAEEFSAESIFVMLVDNPAFRSVYNLGHLVQVTDHSNTVIDIFIHYREAGKVWHGTDVHKWINTSFGLAEMRLGSHTFLIPDDAHRYLDENYGNWKKPVLFWDYSFDTPNRQFFRNKKTAYYLADRIINELHSQTPSRHRVQTAIEELKNCFGIDLTYFLGGKSKVNTEKVVITFGTFDLFHIGHLNILQRAASFGDRLVVGVSSDALNYSKKSIYPVYCQEDRRNIVNSIQYVTETFFEESLELKAQYIKRYNADVLVMGNDWEGKFDHLSDICEVVYLTRTSNISTSETKDAIKKNL